MKIIKQFKRLVAEGMTHKGNGFIMWENEDFLICHQAIDSLFHVDLTDKLDLWFTDKPMCKDSVPVTLYSYYRSWSWAKGRFDDEPQMSHADAVMTNKSDFKLTDHFGYGELLVHGYLTVY